MKKLNRLYQLPCPVIGITGGIACGKTTASEYIKSKGFKVINADLLVKKIWHTKDAFLYLEKNVPSLIINNEIDFKKLRKLFFYNKIVKKIIENYIYTHLKEEFLKEYQNEKIIFYDVPLLFEKEMDSLFDYTILIYSPKSLQMKRLKKRDKIEYPLMRRILKQQLPIESKMSRSNFIVYNTKDTNYLFQKLDTILKSMHLSEDALHP